MDVWVIETGDYSERGVFGVASSLEAAVHYVKARYQGPYIVAWEEKTDSQGELYLEGRFEFVSHHSTEHKARYDFVRYAVAVNA